MTLVAPISDELPGIEMGSSFAVVVNAFAVGEQGPAQSVHRRQGAEGEVVDHRRCQIDDVQRAAGEVDHRDVLDQLVHADGAGGVGASSGDAAKGGAVAHGNDGSGVIEPSTTTRWPPASMVAALASSACLPAAAIIVSW
jgi:hypothetical protein